MAEMPSGQMRRPGTRPRRAWLRAVPWIAALAVAVGLAVWWSRPAGLPPVASLPDPNGYDDALEAARMIEKSGLPKPIRDKFLAVEDPEVLRPFVEANREALAILRRGLGRPFQVPAPVGMDPTAIVDQHQDHGLIRGLAGRALFAEGKLARLDGRPVDAARVFLDLPRLGQLMARDVPMIHYLSGLAVQRLGLIGLRELRDDLDAPGLREVIAALDDLERGRPPASEAARRELRFMEANVRAMGTLQGLSYRLSGVLKKEKARVVADLKSRGLRDDALRRLLRADLAIRLYRLERGEFPDRLDDLAPAYLDAPPIDPYTEGPLIYRKAGDGYLLYSVGPDREDDRLHPTLRPQDGDLPGDLSLDSL